MGLALRMGNLSWLLLGTVGLLSLLGLINLHSTALATQREVHIMQAAWLVIGSMAMLVVIRMKASQIRLWIPLFYLLVLACLAGVLVFGVEVNGSRRWLSLGFARMQPSEFAKLAVITSLALFYERTKAQRVSWGEAVMVALVLGLPIILIFREPDLGHALMILFIGGTMTVYQRFNRRAVLTTVLVGLAALPALWEWGLRDYQKARVLTLVGGHGDALGAGWHSRQARLSVGSGGVFGKGHGGGTQVAGGFLPENHTDFVFAHFAEEHGFIGASAVLALYLILVLLILAHAGRARDTYGALVAVGVASLFFWHVALNVGMVLQVVPVTGVTLPLMSYGGSSAVTVLVAIGLLLNANGQQRGPSLTAGKLAV